MVVAVDLISGTPGVIGGGTSVNITMTVGSGANRALVCLLITEFGSTGVSVHHDSTGTNQNMTLITSVSDTNSLFTAYLFGLVAPTTKTSATIHAAWTGALDGVLAGACFTGVNQTGGATSFAHAVAATGASGATQSSTVTSATGNYCVVGMACGGSTNWGTFNHTSWFTPNNTTAFASAGQTFTGSATVTFSAVSAALPWGLVGCDIVASGGGTVQSAAITEATTTADATDHPPSTFVGAAVEATTTAGVTDHPPSTFVGAAVEATTTAGVTDHPPSTFVGAAAEATTTADVTDHPPSTFVGAAAEATTISDAVGAGNVLSTAAIAETADKTTNFIFPSTNWSANVTAGGTVVGCIQNAGLAPDGTMTAMQIVTRLSSGPQNLPAKNLYASAISSQTITYSIFVQANAGHPSMPCGAGFSIIIGFVQSLFSFTIDVTNQPVLDGSGYWSTTATGASVINYPNNWARLLVTTSMAASSPFNCTLSMYNQLVGTSFSGNNIDGILVWGQQIELGGTGSPTWTPFTRQYVPTTTAAASAYNILDFVNDMDTANLESGATSDGVDATIVSTQNTVESAIFLDSTDASILSLQAISESGALTGVVNAAGSIYTGNLSELSALTDGATSIALFGTNISELSSTTDTSDHLGNFLTGAIVETTTTSDIDNASALWLVNATETNTLVDASTGLDTAPGVIQETAAFTAVNDATAIFSATIAEIGNINSTLATGWVVAMAETSGFAATSDAVLISAAVSAESSTTGDAGDVTTSVWAGTISETETTSDGSDAVDTIFGAVAIDHTSSVTAGHNVTSLDMTFTVASGINNRCLIVTICLEASASALTVHWDSFGTNQNLVLLGIVTDPGTGAVIRMYGWQPNPTSGTKNIHAAWTGTSDCTMSAISFVNVINSGGPLAGSGTGSDAAIATHSPTSKLGDYMVAVWLCATGTPWNSFNTTQWWSDSSVPAFNSAGVYAPGAPSSETFTAVGTPGASYAFLSMQIEQAPAGSLLERVAISDATDATSTVRTLSETSSISDTVDGRIIVWATSISETSASADAVDGHTTVLATNIAEASTSSDVVNPLNSIFNSHVTESGGTSDSVIGGAQSFTVSITEASSATDSSNAIIAGISVVNVGTTANNTTTAGITFHLTVGGGGIPAGSLILVYWQNTNTLGDSVGNTYHQVYTDSGVNPTPLWYAQSSIALTSSDFIGSTTDGTGNAMSVSYATGIDLNAPFNDAFATSNTATSGFSYPNYNLAVSPSVTSSASPLSDSLVVGVLYCVGHASTISFTDDPSGFIDLSTTNSLFGTQTFYFFGGTVFTSSKQTFAPSVTLHWPLSFDSHTISSEQIAAYILNFGPHDYAPTASISENLTGSEATDAANVKPLQFIVETGAISDTVQTFSLSLGSTILENTASSDITDDAGSSYRGSVQESTVTQDVTSGTNVGVINVIAEASAISAINDSIAISASQHVVEPVTIADLASTTATTWLGAIVELSTAGDSATASYQTSVAVVESSSFSATTNFVPQTIAVNIVEAGSFADVTDHIASIFVGVIAETEALSDLGNTQANSFVGNVLESSATGDAVTAADVPGTSGIVEASGIADAVGAGFVTSVSIVETTGASDAVNATRVPHMPVSITTVNPGTSYATAISSDGTVICGYSSGTGGYSWIYTIASAALTTFAAANSICSAISSDGTVTVGQSGNAAYRWTAAGGLVSIGPSGSTASLVTEDGLTVWGTNTSGVLSSWTSGGGWVTHGVTFTPTAISDDGLTIVGYTGSPRHAVKWTAGGGLVTLGDLGGNYTSALDVVADGSVIYGFALNAGGTVNLTFQWTAGGGIVDLGIGSNFQMYGGSPDCLTLVGSSGASMYWTAGGGLITLPQPASGSSFAVDAALGGKIIAGYGGGASAGPLYWIIPPSIYNVSITEAATSADSSRANYLLAIPETTAATDGVSAIYLTTSIVNEATVTQESADRTEITQAAITETVGCADIGAIAASSYHGEVTENAGLVDASDEVDTTLAVIAETTALTETCDASLVWQATVLESAIAGSAVDALVDWQSTIQEITAIQDVAESAASFWVGTIQEQSAIQDLPSVMPGIVESLTIADTVGVTLSTWLGGILEGVVAVDSHTATATMSIALSEALNAIESYVDGLVESGLTANIQEGGSFSDVVETEGHILEAASVGDLCDARIITASQVIEIASIVDQVLGVKAHSFEIMEGMSLIDLCNAVKLMPPATPLYLLEVPAEDRVLLYDLI